MTPSSDSVTILPGVVPRWEWRAFGRRFDVAAQVLAEMTPERTGSSEEQYVLSARTDASVKVRAGELDVKLRLAVDVGLERWAPVMKADFPVSADEVTAVLAALDAPGRPDEHSSSSSFADLIELLEAQPGLLVVDVEKHRRHFRVDDCIVESTEVTVDGATIQTVSVEMEDPGRVLDVVARLGLADRANTCMARGLKALVGFATSRLAVIDVGTNSVKYHLAERLEDGTSRTLADRAEMTRLGEGQSDDGVLAEEPVLRTVDAIVSMASEARELGPVDIVAVGTAGLRRAPNRAVVIDVVRDRVGIEVEVISGPDEARLAYLAATSALPTVTGRLAVFDSGGGSTQFTFGRDGHVDEQFSVDVGAVRVSEPFGLASAVGQHTLDRVFEFLSGALDRLDDRARPAAVVAIGGTSTNLAAVAHGLDRYEPDIVHGTQLDVAELDRQIELYRSLTADERRSIPGLQAARAEIILGGACIVRTVLAKLDHDVMTVSDRGLRHGVVIDRFGQSPR